MEWKGKWTTPDIEKEGLIHPTEIEKQLNITPSERKKWQNKGYLKIGKLLEVYYKGRYVNVPYFLPETLHISSETIEKWRKQDLESKKEKLKAAREQAIEKTHETLNKRKEILYDLEEKINSLLPYSKIALNASFWTRLDSKWAKRQQLKGNRRNTTSPEVLYELKNDIIKNIWQLREQLKNEKTNIELKFYIPEKPDRYNFLFCDYHYEQFAMERKDLYYGYYSVMDFFMENKKEILKCKDCQINIQENYYSLYSFKINFSNNIKYHFHVPYPIGKKYFPDYKQLEKVKELENEYGLFRFGAPVSEEEERLFPLKLVEKETRKILEELSLSASNLK